MRSNTDSEVDNDEFVTSQLSTLKIGQKRKRKVQTEKEKDEFARNYFDGMRAFHLASAE